MVPLDGASGGGGYEHTLRIVRRRHDVIPIVVTDPREADVGSILGFGFAPFAG